MLHRLSRLEGFHIHAADGEIGHVDDVLVDEQTWAIQYLIVDTSNWIGGRWVVISPSALRGVDWGKGRIDVSLTREQIKNGPLLETMDVPPSDKWPEHGIIF